MSKARNPASDPSVKPLTLSPNLHSRWPLRPDTRSVEMVQPENHRQLLGNNMTSQQKHISITEIQDAVARAFHLSRAELLSRSRRQHVAYARHIAMYLSREMAGRMNEGGRTVLSFPRIARAFCRDHSSVIHACNAIDRRRQIDGAFANLIENLAQEVRDGTSMAASLGVM
jgi:chromosomal replication initiation ATPase DnaA